MQVKNLHPKLCNEAHYIHLEAIGAPTLDIPIQFADQASSFLCAYRDKYQFGASGMMPRCGLIYDRQNQTVGRISYNGRIWDANDHLVE